MKCAGQRGLSMPVGRGSGASAHGEAGIGEPVGQDSLGVLAAHGQQLVHREGGGAEDGLEGDGLDALSPQLTQRGQRSTERGCEPSDADGEGIAALGAGVGDDRAALVGDSQAGEGRGGCGRGGRAAVRRGRRLPGITGFSGSTGGGWDLIDDLAVGIGGGDFCARASLSLMVSRSSSLPRCERALPLGLPALAVSSRLPDRSMTLL